ncbi:L-type lectin family protein [Companilactobacillus keshanensis]|uniref:Cell surface protein n=1 Tax=Companilactobacillus keshanensis TaxID=2486003 RepID=A0ABW4BSB5_9LACO|nr:hypothetical protein [Companilactobacillus keshanensis]
MKTKYKLGLWELLFFMSIFVILTTNTNNASAALTSSTDLAVLKDAPNGIAVSSYMSNSNPVSPTSGFPYTTNSAQVVDKTGANSSNGNIVSLANGANTNGSIWSTNQTFDINKPQTISAWLYFGAATNDASINSEGIAFVLQNDSRGIASLGAGYDGMGVYGYDRSAMNVFNSIAEDTSYLQKTAIQNSVALGFDAEKNNLFNASNVPIKVNTTLLPITTNYSQNGFDTQLGSVPPSSLEIPGKTMYGSVGNYGNIAVTYPAYEGTYFQIDISGTAAASNYPGFDKGTVMVHSTSKSADLVDDIDPITGKSVFWHHVTINWTPAPSGSDNGTLSYVYNDISKDGLENSSKYQTTADIPVDTTKLNTTSGKVRWGFTGSNGTNKSVATKLVALDSIPESPTTDASASITDKTLNKKITDSATDKNVANGDALSLDYNLSYIRGDEDWKSVAAKIKIPSNVTLAPDANGDIATIKYADGKTQIITQADIDADGNLQATLAYDLHSADSSATISISVVANNDTTSDINVKQAAASFTGTNSIAMTSSPAFTITGKKDYSLVLGTDSSTNYDLLYKNDDSNFNPDLNLGYSSSAPSGVEGSDIVFKIEVGDHTYMAAQDIDIESGSTASTNIDIKQVIEGMGDSFWDIFPLDSTQPVKVTAIDRTNGLVSNTLTYNVTVKPNKALSLNVSDSLAFQNIHFGNKSDYLKRKSTFDLSVTSLREPWSLSVTTNGLYNSSNSLNNNMNLVYKKDTASDYMTIGTTPVEVETNDNSYDTSTTNNISGNWTSDTGLLLKQSGISPVGTYTGTLTWTVSDAIPNN